MGYNKSVCPVVETPNRRTFNLDWRLNIVKKFTSQLTLSYSETGNRKKPRRNGNSQRQYKRKCRKADEYACAVCGWKEPDFFRELSADITMMVHAHHVLPVKYGGNDSTDNLLLLCPICHEYADFLADNGFRELFKSAGLFDPHDRTSLVASLKILRKTPNKWWEMVKSAFDKAQGELTETLSRIFDE